MRHYKIIDGDYLIAIGTGSGGEEITVEEYDGLKAVIGERPAAPEGYGRKLKTDLTWEEYELPPVVEEDISMPDGQALGANRVID